MSMFSLLRGIRCADHRQFFVSSEWSIGCRVSALLEALPDERRRDPENID